MTCSCTYCAVFLTQDTSRRPVQHPTAAVFLQQQCVCVCVCVCVCARVCVRACVRACVCVLSLEVRGQRRAGIVRWQADDDDDDDDDCVLSCCTYKCDCFILGPLSSFWNLLAIDWPPVHGAPYRSTLEKIRELIQMILKQSTRNDNLWVQEGALMCMKGRCAWHNTARKKNGQISAHVNNSNYAQ
jgi:hypothetical protein